MKPIIALLSLFLTLSALGRTQTDNECLSLSPNPADSEFTIEWGDPEYEGSVIITIYNEVGKVVQEMIIDRYESVGVVVDISAQASGIYFVRAVDENGNSCNSVRLVVL